MCFAPSIITGSKLCKWLIIKYLAKTDMKNRCHLPYRASRNITNIHYLCT